MRYFKHENRSHQGAFCEAAKECCTHNKCTRSCRYIREQISPSMPAMAPIAPPAAIAGGEHAASCADRCRKYSEGMSSQL